MAQRLLFCAAIWCLCVLPLGAAGRAGTGILPHRALYELSMLHNRDANVLAVDGDMAFEWQDSCDGWSVNQRSQMAFYYGGGETTKINWSLVSWEAKDGGAYRFIVRQMTDGKLSDEFRGDASVAPEGGAGTAHYTAPDEHTVTLPSGSLFPSAHSLALLKRALAGDTLFWAHVFDGSDAEGLFGVSAVITPLSAAARARADAEPTLKGVPGWHIALAFYAPASQAAEPEHEQQLDLFENGVVDELQLDYGDFTVLAVLKKLEPLPTPKC
jgi:EipB-like